MNTSAPLARALVAALFVAAPLPARAQVAAVDLDVESGVFLSKLPFDVPFTVGGRALPGTTRVIAISFSGIPSMAIFPPWHMFASISWKAEAFPDISRPTSNPSFIPSRFWTSAILSSDLAAFNKLVREQDVPAVVVK